MSAATDLFAYGSLMFPQVWEHVVGKQHASQKVVLPGHLAYRVEGATFPGLVPADPQDSTPGILYSGLDDSDWRVLDAFEDVFYDRVTVRVQDDGGAEREADTYRVRDNERDVLTSEIWTAEWFTKHGLAVFLANIGA